MYGRKADGDDIEGVEETEWKIRIGDDVRGWRHGSSRNLREKQLTTTHHRDTEAPSNKGEKDGDYGIGSA